MLELLVAMAVFSILSITAYNGLRNFITAQAILEDSEAEFSTIQKAVTTIERDLKSAITRSIRDELGDDVAAMRLAPDNALELTRKRPGVPIEFNLVDMVRVDYVIVDGILSRRVWDVLDRVPETGYEETVLLSDLDDVSWSFYR
ncbi:MAG: type II secretion system minor pseudopilin GspJ, partial [Pseudomonadota bacterium]